MARNVKIAWQSKYSGWASEARRIKERLQEPVMVDGKLFYCTSQAASAVGLNIQRLRRLCKYVDGDFIVITLPNGIRFIRMPRHKGDQNAPLYFDVDSIRQAHQI